MKPNRILQVLLFRESKKSRELGLALWAAFKEVEAFYQRAPLRAEFERFYLSDTVPDPIKAELSLNWAEIAQRVPDETFWELARGRYSRTFDRENLAEGVRRCLGTKAKKDSLVLVTDQEITPPKDWRYIIWGRCSGGAVISVAPTDPLYWGARDERRLATIKHRVRTACCSVVGTRLGLQGCQNPRCFLFTPVDSVVQLDDMVYLGREHDIPDLARRGFVDGQRDPNQEQSIGLDAMSDECE